VTSYAPETFPEGGEADDGTIVENRDRLAAAVVGRKIIDAEQDGRKFRLTLDNGRVVTLHDTDDCCAYTELAAFLLHPEMVDHVILGVGTTDGFETWHVYADAGDVLELSVAWSCGNPFYYGYGFNIVVEDPA
jgi:hypothetical protein